LWPFIPEFACDIAAVRTILELRRRPTNFSHCPAETAWNLPHKLFQAAALPHDPSGANDKCHFYKCQTCGAMVDKRQLDDVLFHEDHRHRPNIPYEGPGVRLE
jgi:hypothetical protein